MSFAQTQLVDGGGGGGAVAQKDVNAADDALVQDMQAYGDGQTDAVYDPNLEELLNYDPLAGANPDAQYAANANTLGIFGMPYQFMEHVDPRIGSGSGSIGAEYADRIVANIPLFFMSPGVPAFMKSYSKEEERNILSAFISKAAGNDAASADDLVSKNGKFYTFKYAVNEYYNYVNPMCQITAKLMGVGGRKLPDGQPAESADWMSYTQTAISGFASFSNDYMAVPFYIDTDTQVSESFSNDVTDTSLASTVDGFSDMGRELMFYLGYGSNMAGFDQLTRSGVFDQPTQAMTSFIDSAISDNNIFKTLVSQISSVVTGGRLIFPKIWSDSNFSRSYDVNLKLRSPDNDPFSIWLNIVVPLCHILGFVQPRMVAENPNAYMSPFIVRGTYKGFFNIDMGMITGANITKGDDGAWTPNGVPTSVDVSLTITDLYETMSMTATKSWGEEILAGTPFGSGGSSTINFDTMDNTAQMDYLMTLCGVNVFKPEIGRMVDLWLTQEKNKLTGSGKVFSNLRNNISEAILNIYQGAVR